MLAPLTITPVFLVLKSCAWPQILRECGPRHDGIVAFRSPKYRDQTVVGELKIDVPGTQEIRTQETRTQRKATQGKITTGLQKIARALGRSLLLSISLWLGSSVFAQAEKLTVTVKDQVNVGAQYNFTLTPEVIEVLHSGQPLYFASQVDISRIDWRWNRRNNTLWESTKNKSRAFFRWFKASDFSQRYEQKLSYHLLQGNYRVTRGTLWRAFPTLEEALTMIRSPPSFDVIDRDELQNQGVYLVRARLWLMTEKLPTPFQLETLKNDNFQNSSAVLAQEFEINE